MSDEVITEMTEEKYKSFVKTQVKERAFEDLKNIQNEHSKVNNIRFENMNKPQEYLTSELSNNKTSKMLFNMRCESVRGIRNNFHKFYSSDTSCPFQCENKKDTQQNVLNCKELIKYISKDHKKNNNTVQYNHIYDTPAEQINVAKLFQVMMTTQERLLEESLEPACHGNNSGP